MAKRKKKSEAVPRHLDRLYKAVAYYVEKTGGKLVVVGGVQVQAWPGEGPYKFVLGIKCLGRKPSYSTRPQPSIGTRTCESD